MKPHVSTRSSLLHPTRDSDAQWLHARILKRSNQPFGVRLY
jgi:hypothetical protein